LYLKTGWRAAQENSISELPGENPRLNHRGGGESGGGQPQFNKRKNGTWK